MDMPASMDGVLKCEPNTSLLLDDPLLDCQGSQQPQQQQTGRRRQPVKPKGSGPGRPLTADRKRPYPCLQCTSRFGSKMELEEHQNSHTGHKPFQCDICLARFNRRSTLWNHKRIHSETKPFTCSVCHMTFKWKNSLKCHTEMHLRKNEQVPTYTQGSPGTSPNTQDVNGYLPPLTYASAKRQTEELQNQLQLESRAAAAAAAMLSVSGTDLLQLCTPVATTCSGAGLIPDVDVKYSLAPTPIDSIMGDANNGCNGMPATSSQDLMMQQSCLDQQHQQHQQQQQQQQQPKPPTRSRKRNPNAKPRNRRKPATVVKHEPTEHTQQSLDCGMGIDSQKLLDGQSSLLQLCHDTNLGVVNHMVDSWMQPTQQPMYTASTSPSLLARTQSNHSTPPSDPAPHNVVCNAQPVQQPVYQIDPSFLLGGSLMHNQGENVAVDVVGDASTGRSPVTQQQQQPQHDDQQQQLQHQQHQQQQQQQQQHMQPQPSYTPNADLFATNDQQSYYPQFVCNGQDYLMASPPLAAPAMSNYYNTPPPNTQYIASPTSYQQSNGTLSGGSPQFIEGCMVKVLPCSQW